LLTGHEYRLQLTCEVWCSRSGVPIQVFVGVR